MRGDILDMVVLGKPRLFRRGMASFSALSRTSGLHIQPTFTLLSAAHLLELSLLHAAARILRNYAAM